MSGSKFLAVAFSLVAFTGWTVVYCHGFIGKPELQAEISKITSADAADDVAAALAAGGGRFAAFGGMRIQFPGANGAAAMVFGWNCVAASHHASRDPGRACIAARRRIGRISPRLLRRLAALSRALLTS